VLGLTGLGACVLLNRARKNGAPDDDLVALPETGRVEPRKAHTARPDKAEPAEL